MMKINIIKKPSKDYYDEFLYLAFKYKRIKQNPNKKATKMTTYLFKQMIFVIIYLLILLLFYYTDSNIFYLFLAVVIVILLFALGIYYYNIKKAIYNYLQDNKKSIIHIDEEGIGLYQENHQNITINWGSIAVIVIHQYSITFIPKSNTAMILSLPSDYKEMFLTGIQLYQKEHLVVDNTNLYL